MAKTDSDVLAEIREAAKRDAERACKAPESMAEWDAFWEGFRKAWSTAIEGVYLGDVTGLAMIELQKLCAEEYRSAFDSLKPKTTFSYVVDATIQMMKAVREKQSLEAKKLSANRIPLTKELFGLDLYE